MRISLNWLREYVDVKVSAEELATQLTMAGLEVESIDHLGDKYRGFVVGEVVQTARHPNADKLTLCKVDVKKDVLRIVCGAPNVAAGQRVAVGLIGALVPRNQHAPAGEPFTLSRVKIRGEESFGMICSEYELDLGDDKDGIMVLKSHAEIGSDLSQYLGLDDTVFEIGITPNRPDAMSHIGVAREVAASYGTKLKLPAVKLKESKALTRKVAKILVAEKSGCPRYTARVMFGVRIGESPEWLRKRLEAVNIRPVNNVVDITNYVLMEIGHPLHAFDYDKLNAHTIIVRRAKQGDQFITLDHKTRQLKDDTLMIYDADGYVAIAGIMGGANTEISETTKNIFIESAYFDPRWIRRTSKFLGLSTEASQRFERGSDPNITLRAVDRAAELIQRICGGEALHAALDAYPQKLKARMVNLRPEKANEVLGTKLGARTISGLLRKIEIKEIRAPGRSRSERLAFSVPTFRPDIEREIDLVEEIARIYGYNNIETQKCGKVSFHSQAPGESLIDHLRECLAGSGFAEIISNSMQEVSIASIASSNIVHIGNPITRDMAALRTSLLPGMLQIIRNNLFHGSKDLRLFEFGKAYFRDVSSREGSPVPGYTEENRLIIACSGVASPPAWDTPARSADLYDLKGELETLFRKILLDNIKFIPYPTTKALTDMGLLIEIHGVIAGEIGRVHKGLMTRFEVEQEVFFAEVNTDLLLEKISSRRTFKPLGKYPLVTRDVAFVVDENLAVGDIEESIREAGGSLLRRLELFDTYRGNQIHSGKKSLAFALEFLSEDHTLTQEEIDRVMHNIITAVSKKFDGVLRG